MSAKRTRKAAAYCLQSRCSTRTTRRGLRAANNGQRGMGMEIDGLNLAMGGSAVTAIAGIAGAWIKAKFGKTTVPQPLETREEPRFVTCDQCAEHRKAINARIDDIGPALGRVFKKLDENNYRVDCSVGLSEFTGFFDITTESESATLGGWVVEMLDKLPEVGDEFQTDTLKITVTEIDSHRVAFANVCKLEKSEEE